VFEAFLKEAGQVLEKGRETAEWLFPAVLVEVVDEEFHFNHGFAFRMEVAAGITTHRFDEVIEAFGQVGGAQETVRASGVVKEGQVVFGSGFEVFDPGRVFGTERVEETLEALEGGVIAGGGQDFAPGLFVELVIFAVQMSEGIAVEMNGAELVLAAGE